MPSAATPRPQRSAASGSNAVQLQPGPRHWGGTRPPTTRGGGATQGRHPPADRHADYHYRRKTRSRSRRGRTEESRHRSHPSKSRRRSPSRRRGSSPSRRRGSSNGAQLNLTATPEALAMLAPLTGIITEREQVKEQLAKKEQELCQMREEKERLRKELDSKNEELHQEKEAKEAAEETAQDYHDMYHNEKDAKTKMERQLEELEEASRKKTRKLLRERDAEKRVKEEAQIENQNLRRAAAALALQEKPPTARRSRRAPIMTPALFAVKTEVVDSDEDREVTARLAREQAAAAPKADDDSDEQEEEPVTALAPAVSAASSTGKKDEQQRVARDDAGEEEEEDGDEEYEEEEAQAEDEDGSDSSSSSVEEEDLSELPCEASGAVANGESSAPCGGAVTAQRVPPPTEPGTEDTEVPDTQFDEPDYDADDVLSEAERERDAQQE